MKLIQYIFICFAFINLNGVKVAILHDGSELEEIVVNEIFASLKELEKLKDDRLLNKFSILVDFGFSFILNKELAKCVQTSFNNQYYKIDNSVTLVDNSVLQVGKNAIKKIDNNNVVLRNPIKRIIDYENCKLEVFSNAIKQNKRLYFKNKDFDCNPYCVIAILKFIKILIDKREFKTISKLCDELNSNEDKFCNKINEFLKHHTKKNDSDFKRLVWDQIQNFKFILRWALQKIVDKKITKFELRNPGLYLKKEFDECVYKLEKTK